MNILSPGPSERPHCTIFVMVGALALVLTAESATVTVKRDGGVPLSPVLYSAFLETEINFGGEGGLYAEMIMNRDFEALGRGMVATPGSTPAANLSNYDPWRPLGGAALALENTTAPFPSNPMTLRLQGSAGDGIENPGYWGVGARPGVGFVLSFYAKSATAVNLSAQVLDGSTVLSQGEVNIAGGGQWTHHTATLPAAEILGPVHATFALILKSATKSGIQLDSVSLFPADAVQGLFRKDIVDQLSQLRPGFIRTPGGSYMAKYNWKATVGPAPARAGHFNQAWGYWVTDGLGAYELLLLAELLGSELQMVLQVISDEE